MLDFAIKDSGPVVTLLIALGGAFVAFVVWRTTVSVKLEAMRENIKSLSEQHAELTRLHTEFEREVRTNYVTASAISEIRTAMDRGFAALTERVDRLIGGRRAS